jgi:hypothetical protein
MGFKSSMWCMRDHFGLLSRLMLLFVANLFGLVITCNEARVQNTHLISVTLVQVVQVLPLVPVPGFFICNTGNGTEKVCMHA